MDFTEKLRLHGKAAEDLYFAQLDKQLIEAMHDKQMHQDHPLHLDDHPEPIEHAFLNRDH